MFKEETHSSFWSEAKSLVYIAIIALVVRTFIIEPFFIPTGSMKHTLLEHDYVFATKYNYGYSKHSFLFIAPHFIKGRILGTLPERGDIIIFKSNHDNFDKRYIKRLIGLPGDKIQMISGVLYINDNPIEREFLGQYIGETARHISNIKKLFQMV
jgi:signal peptidase I